MASEKQILANRANAQLSTGPKTPEGKDVSRRNGLLHGLASLGFVLPIHFESEILETAEWLHSTIKPGNVYESTLESTLSFHVVCFQEANRLQIARKHIISLEAETSWDDNLLAAAAALAESLPKKPVMVARQLRCSKHGCLVMIDLWNQLDDALGRAGKWDDEQQSMALDLMGISHAVRKTGSVLDVPTGSPASDHLRGIVLAQRASLEAKIADGLADLDQAKRNIALLGCDPLDIPMRLFKRYSREHLYIVLKLRAEFGRLDRKGNAYVPTGVPKRHPAEPRSDFHDRLNEWKEKCRMRDERERAAAHVERMRANEEADRLEREAQPVFHEGLDIAVYIQRVTEWNNRRLGRELPPLEPVPENGAHLLVTPLTDAMPPEVAPDEETQPEDHPGDDSAQAPATPARKPRKRHNR